MVVVAVAVLVTIVWFLAGRTSRSSAGQDSSAAGAVTSAAPTMTGVLANSTAPSRSTVPSPSPSPSPSVGPSPSPAASPAPADPPASPAGSPTDTASAPDAAATSANGSIVAAAPADPAPESAPAAAPPAAAPPSYDADGRLLCPDAAIGVSAEVPAQVRSGATVIVGMVVTNTGTEQCRRDVSGTAQVFTVFGADGTRLWSTADCFPGQGTDVRELAPGQTLKYTVKWSGTTSAPGCTGERAPLAPGSYTLIAQLGALSSPPAAFTVA